MRPLKLLVIMLACVPALALAQAEPQIQKKGGEGSNDFPTFDRVGYALVCMDSHGGQSVETLTACSCRIDYIASKMSYTEYDEASTYLRYKRMPGKKGGIFREMEHGEELVDKLNKVRDEATKACPIAKRSPDSREN